MATQTPWSSRWATWATRQKTWTSVCGARRTKRAKRRARYDLLERRLGAGGRVSILSYLSNLSLSLLKTLQEEAGHDQDNTVKVDDASKLDYAQGQDQEEEEGAGNDRPATEAPQDAAGGEEPAPEEDQEDGRGQGEEDEDLGEYEDRPEDRGHVRPEAPDEEMQLPDDLNLDGGEGEDEGGEEPEGDGAQEKEPVVKDQGGAFPEQPDPMEEEEGREEEAPGGEQQQQQPEGEGGAEEDGAGGADDGMRAAPEEEEEGAPDECEDAQAEDAPMVGGEDDLGQQEAAQADGERGQAAAAAAAAGIDQGAGQDANAEEANERLVLAS